MLYQPTSATMATLASASRSGRTRSRRGFTLIALMVVGAILGILAAIAIAAYMKNVRNAHRAEVLGDISNITLRERAAFNVRGAYVTTTINETDLYPLDANALQTAKGAVRWNVTDAEYSRDAQGDAAYFRGGGAAHGWDALNFVPENAASWCSYGVVSGDGTQGTFKDLPPGQPLSLQVFPTGSGADQYWARDWFYVFAKCDFDRDGLLWDFTSTHYSSSIVEANEGE